MTEDHGKYCCCTNCSTKRKKERTHTFGIEIKTSVTLNNNIDLQNNIKNQLCDRIKTMKKDSNILMSSTETNTLNKSETQRDSNVNTTVFDNIMFFFTKTIPNTLSSLVPNLVP